MRIVGLVARLACAALALVATLAAPPALAQTDLLTTPGAAARAAATVFGKIGRTPDIYRIAITPRELVIDVQGERDFHVEQYRWRRWSFWLFGGESVSGPATVDPGTPVRDVTGGFFPYPAELLEMVPALSEAAVARAGLEDAAQVTAFRVDRRVSILPQASFGEVRATISVSSGHERATVYAATDGRIVGADLSGTRRAKLLDMLEDDWHLEQAAADIHGLLPADLPVWSIGISRSSIGLEVENTEDPRLLTRYTWNLNGLSRQPIDTPNTDLVLPRARRASYLLGEIDLTILPDLKRKARELLEMPDGKLMRIRAERPVTGLDEPRLVWTVDVREPGTDPGVRHILSSAQDAEFGRVAFDMEGEPASIVLPLSRRPQPEWFTPETIRSTLDRIGETFGPEARFIEISINDRNANITLHDPMDSGALVKFLVDSDSVRPWGQAQEIWHDREAVFAIEALDAYDAELLARLWAQTMEALDIADGAVSRLTFSRGNAWAKPRDQMVMLEIRVEPPGGWNSGRITYEPDATPIDVVMPSR